MATWRCSRKSPTVSGHLETPWQKLTKSQRQKFIHAALDMGADSDPETFMRALEQIAKVPGAKVIKAAKKHKR